jgi:hypothetical protein
VEIFSTKVGFSRDLGFDGLCMPSMGSSVAAAHDHVVSGGISYPLKFTRPRWPGKNVEAQLEIVAGNSGWMSRLPSSRAFATNGKP